MIKNTSNNTDPLWTKNFTIITLGTVVSMLGSAMSSFAISLMVLDYTKSTFLYTLFMVVYILPSIILPIVSGPYLDRYSRKKVIYTLDFISAVIYFIVFIVIKAGLFNYGYFLIIVFIIGAIDGVYRVAYDSLYPNLVSEVNYTKAYSIESILYPLSTCMVPVASYIYYSAGTAAPIFLVNAISFLIAATFETRIDYQEKHVSHEKEKKFSMKSFKKDFNEGLEYLKNEKGLQAITLYFAMNSLLGGASYTLGLPFFKNNSALFSRYAIDAATLFTLVNSTSIIGRFIGGTIQYKFKFSTDKKFAIALFVYITLTLIDSTAFYFPVIIMAVLFFISGLLGVTSYNIRISSTQSYLPDNKRARFTGIFNMSCNAGTIVGQLVCGATSEFVGERPVIFIFGMLNLLAVYFIVYKNRSSVKNIYNRTV